MRLGRSRGRRQAIVLMIGGCLLAGPARAQLHPSQLPELTPDAEFPRCTEHELASAGFPDHKHRQHWTTWETPRDAEGRSYGPGTLCNAKALTAGDELVVLPGEKRYRRYVMFHNPGYEDCDMLPFLELMDWAHHEVAQLLGLTTDDTLTIFNPDKTEHYRAQTRQGVWRLYRLEGNEVTIQPYPVLMARTLDGHAAFMLTTDWILRRVLPADLPPWLHQGLVEYMGEDGCHLLNYMAQFRPQGEILFSPPLTDAILSRDIDPDEDKDRENFRRACYSAFLMVWQLVEFEGGLQPLQGFLGQVAAGADPDEAARAAWGMDLAMLAELLDPALNGEPGGGKLPTQRPHVEP